MSDHRTTPPRVPSSAVKRRLVAVGGPHSGAGLVRELLGACGGIHDVGESGLFVEIAGRPRRYRPWTLLGLSSGRERRMLGRLLARTDRQGDTGPALPPRDPRLSRAFSDAVATLDRMALSAGCRSWVEHTPGVPLQAAALERLIPRLRIVHVIRDGRDEVAAHCVRAAGGRGCRPADAAGAVDRWNSALGAHARCFGRRGHSFVLYEDLVHDPARELLRLLREAGLGHDAEAVGEAVGAVDLPAPRCDRARFRELFAAQRRRRLEARLDLARYARLAERLRHSTLFGAGGIERAPRPLPRPAALDSG